MTLKTKPQLENVAETLLITLYSRALEAQRADALIKDERAMKLVKQLNYDFERIKVQPHDQLFIILRVRKFDNHVREFLSRNPKGVIVHIGCGLDTRFERVDNGECEWFDLDLPEVIDLRKNLGFEETTRHHMVSASVLSDEWLKPLEECKHVPMIFLAEGVFPYFTTADVKSVIRKIREFSPGSELVLDGHKGYLLAADNAQLMLGGLKAQMRWNLNNPREVEKWGENIRLLDEWYYFDDPEPRMKLHRWMTIVPGLSKSSGVFHYRLG